MDAVIVVPGIMGTQLTLNGETIWPGPAASLIFPYTMMDKLMNPAAKPAGIIESFSISSQYAALLSDLRACGFNEAEETLATCPYDWRKTNLLAAQELADVVDRVASGIQQPRIFLVAHSMGGLVSRSYLESGSFTARPGFKAVARLITLATPHRGAPLALTAALGYEKRLFLSAAQVQQLVSSPEFPSLYELLPPRGEPFFWDSAPAARYQPIDVYGTKALGLVQANLDSAQAFRKTLEVARKPAGVDYFYFAGTRQKMCPVVQAAQPVNVAALQRPELDDAGDGTVPIWSATLQGFQGQPVGGEHGSIYKDGDLRHTLGVLLGKPGRLLPSGTQVEMAVRDRVVAPQVPVNVSLKFKPPIRDLDAELRIDRVQTDGDGKETAAATVARMPIKYTGVATPGFSLVFRSDPIPSAYRASLVENTGQRLATDEFFVQT